jgi:hypothetical protein
MFKAGGVGEKVKREKNGGWAEEKRRLLKKEESLSFRKLMQQIKAFAIEISKNMTLIFP